MEHILRAYLAYEYETCCVDDLCQSSYVHEQKPNGLHWVKSMGMAMMAN